MTKQQPLAIYIILIQSNDVIIAIKNLAVFVLVLEEDGYHVQVTYIYQQRMYVCWAQKYALVKVVAPGKYNTRKQKMLSQSILIGQCQSIHKSLEIHALQYLDHHRVGEIK